MTLNPRTAFFDSIAEKWDGWEDLAVLQRKLAAGLEEFGVGPNEKVVDVGCGTGNLTGALLGRLSAAGEVFAVDISPRMLEVARSKVADPRVSWHAADAVRLPLGDASCDRVFCYSVWPHFADRETVAAELRIHTTGDKRRTCAQKVHLGFFGKIPNNTQIRITGTSVIED